MKHSTVIIALDVEGFHQYPGAPTEVYFLRAPHRHTFKIKVGIAVDDLNREREIFIERWKLERSIASAFGTPAQFEARSCEMIADLILKWDAGYKWVEVWEEETGGARVEIDRTSEPIQIEVTSPKR